ncbi:restriction endonuclease subunit S [Cyanobium sp. ATX 6F1]|uniref:restriction endonuclease subunit S n=1 Tax=unclassified Cyanobium TaxID=2627006 RepID=UPI0020CC6F5C|nr:restriction endonuclease subunit S [Cyanobium sp. ATX 6F1]MCP9916936.1 restriction endonuclease subunit S [Cyanobium sp. ATX 6F1]
MSSDYPQVSISSVARVRSGFAFKSSDWQSTGIPVVKIANVKEGRLEMDGCSYVSEVVAHQARDFLLEQGDILISMTGYVGDVARVREADTPCALNQRVGRFHSYNKALIDPSFLFFHLKSKEVRSEIEQKAYGSAQPNISAGGIEETSIHLPELWIQQAIAHILGTLDDKIELNRKTNETLEAMAKALFKSWFVDFDPVRAKAEGRPTGLPDEISDLFADSFEDSELGEIPSGWKIQSAGNQYQISIGKTPPRKEAHWFSCGHLDVPWLSIRDLGEAGVFAYRASECLTREAVERFNVKVVPANTVIVSFKLTVGRVAITACEMLTNEAIAHFSPLRSEAGFEYTYCLLSQYDYHSLGSTSSIATAVNSQILRDMPLLTPSGDIVRAFCDTTTSLFSSIKICQKETQHLSDLRDALLPKLISGEIRIPDAERMLEEMSI